MAAYEPNKITISENGVSVHLTLQAQLGSVDFNHGEARASSAVKIIATPDHPGDMQKLRSVLFGSSVNHSQGIAYQLARRLNGHYLTKDSCAAFKSPLFILLDRLFAPLQGREVVKVWVPREQEEDSLTLYAYLPVIPDRADNAGFTRDVRNTLKEIKNKKESPVLLEPRAR